MRTLILIALLSVLFVPAATAQDSLTATVRGLESVSFGATGDGVADDTAEIQAAIEFGAPSPSVVYIPKGTYRVTSPLEMRSNVSLIGESQSATILYQSDLDECVIEVAQAAGEGIVSRVEISSLTVTHSQPTYVDRAGGGICAGTSSVPEWDPTHDVTIRDVTIRDVARQGIRAWRGPQRWILDNLRVERAGGGGVYFVAGSDLTVIGGHIVETGDDGFNFGNSIQGVSITGTVFDGCGTQSGSPGGRCIYLNGDRITISGVTIRNYEDAAIWVDQNTSSHQPEDVVIDGLIVHGAASLDDDSRIMRVTSLEGDLLVSDMIANGHNDVTDEDNGGIDIQTVNANSTISFDHINLSGVTRGFLVRTAPFISISDSYISASTVGFDVVDDQTVTTLRLESNVWAGAGTEAVNFQAFSSGSTIGTLVTRDNLMTMSGAFLRVPTGHTVTLADMQGDIKTTAGAFLNDIGGSGVTALIGDRAVSAPTCTTPGTVVRAEEVFSATGASLGFVILYDGCS